MNKIHPLRQQESLLFGETMLGRDKYPPLKRAYGSTLIDANGKKYIDFTSGWNVTNIGWNNREVEQAIIEQTLPKTSTLSLNVPAGPKPRRWL